MNTIEQVFEASFSQIDNNFLTVADADKLQALIVDFCNKNGKSSEEYNKYVKSLH
jgi:hypothetical protein